MSHNQIYVSQFMTTRLWSTSHYCNPRLRLVAMT